MSEESLEGLSQGGRTLSEYEECLGINRQELENKKILNFGAGATNLSRTLEKAKIDAELIDIDLIYDPADSIYNPLSHLARQISDWFIRHEKNPLTRDKLIAKKRRLLGIDGRKIIQGDGEYLPIADKAFDLTLALQSTYQIPEEKQYRVFSELLRVSKEIRIFPIWRQEFDILKQLALEQGFDIVACQPLPVWPFKKVDLSKDGGVVKPTRQKSPASSIGGVLVSAGTQGGHSIRLLRQN